MAICLVWWLPLLLLFFLRAYGQNSVSNCLFRRVLISTSVGILPNLWRRYFNLSPWFYALLLARRALKQKLYFHAARCDIPTIKSNGKKRKYKRPYYRNLAFGGRGPPYVARGYRIFDSTLGYPGEGWEKLKIATWNTRSLTYERFQYCTSLQYDILAITELWRNQSKFQTRSKKFIVSAPKTIPKGPKKGKIRFPDDKAAGVGLCYHRELQTR